jgi:hypothetical protein
VDQELLTKMAREGFVAPELDPNAVNAAQAEGECFYDLATRRVSVVINLQLACLCVFAHSRAYVSGKGDYVDKKAMV